MHAECDHRKVVHREAQSRCPDYQNKHEAERDANWQTHPQGEACIHTEDVDLSPEP